MPPTLRIVACRHLWLLITDGSLTSYSPERIKNGSGLILLLVLKIPPLPPGSPCHYDSCQWSVRILPSESAQPPDRKLCGTCPLSWERSSASVNWLGANFRLVLETEPDLSKTMHLVEWQLLICDPIACAVLSVTTVASVVSSWGRNSWSAESRNNLSMKVTLLPGFEIRARIPVQSESSDVLWISTKGKQQAVCCINGYFAWASRIRSYTMSRQCLKCNLSGITH